MKTLKKNYQNNQSIAEPLNQVTPILKPFVAANEFKKDFSDIVTIENTEEIPYYSAILGNEFNPKLSSNPFHNENVKEIDWVNEREKLYEIFHKISPVNKYVVKLDLALNKGERCPEKIDKELVHKLDSDNVIISKPQKLGNVWYFNMFNKIKEFNFDHESDHMQGMLLMEAARQTGIATVHLNGLSVSGKLNMSSMFTKFNNYVEYDSPVIIRSMSNRVIFDQNQSVKTYVIVNLIQFGKICLTVYLEGVAFNNGSDLGEYRNRSVKINQRVEIKYQALLKEIRQ